MTFEEAELIITEIAPPDTFIALDHYRVWLNGLEHRASLYIGNPYRRLWEGPLDEVVAQLQDFLMNYNDYRHQEMWEAELAV